MNKLAVTCLVLAAAWPSHALAQGTARSMDIDLSIRAAGMGGASTALTWGDGLNHWANPALLGYVKGIGYEYGRTQLVPDLAADVHLTSQVVKLGAGGIGVVLSGRPIDTGGVRLDYGQSRGTDETGQPTTTFGSYESVDSWGFGVNALELVGQLGLTALSRHADASFGMNFKKVYLQLAPASYGGTAQGETRDWGAVVRVTPLLQPGDGFRSLVRVDLAAGVSEINYNEDARFVFLNEDQASPPTFQRRYGASARFAMSPAAWPPDHLREGVWRFVFDDASPLVSFGMTYDHADIGTAVGGTDYRTDGAGGELSVARLVALRLGSYQDKAGELEGVTWGWSVSLPVAGVGRVRYEEASWPQCCELRDLRRRAFSAWLYPGALWEALVGG